MAREIDLVETVQRAISPKALNDAQGKPWNDSVSATKGEIYWDADGHLWEADQDTKLSPRVGPKWTRLKSLKELSGGAISAHPGSSVGGGSPAVSFTNVLFDLRREVGDGSQFGASSIVGKIIELEKALDAASVRIATLETTGSHTSQSHGHAGVAADFAMPVNAQGTHYLIITDDKSAPAHIGKNLLDEQPHKVSLDWTVGFDPHSVEGVDWDVHAPAVWVQSGTTFKQMIDPVTQQVLTYAAIKSFVENNSVITLAWDATALIFKVMKVEHGTVVAP